MESEYYEEGHYAEGGDFYEGEEHYEDGSYEAEGYDESESSTQPTEDGDYDGTTNDEQTTDDEDDDDDDDQTSNTSDEEPSHREMDMISQLIEAAQKADITPSPSSRISDEAIALAQGAIPRGRRPPPSRVPSKLALLDADRSLADKAPRDRTSTGPAVPQGPSSASSTSPAVPHLVPHAAQSPSVPHAALCPSPPGSDSSFSVPSPPGSDNSESASLLTPSASMELSGSGLSHRDKIIHEILETEQVYVKSLTLLIDDYLTPLEKPAPNTPLFALNQTIPLKSLIPSEVRIILQFNTILLLSLQDKIANWSEKQTLAQAFEQMTHLLKVYQNYVNRYDECLKAIARCKKHADFNAFLERVALKVGSDLPSLLIRPVQRIPRYVLLLQDLIKHTPQDHPDYTGLVDAFTKMKSTCDFINTSKRQAEARDRLVSLHDLLLNYPGKIMMAHRRFVREFPGVTVEELPDFAAPSDTASALQASSSLSTGASPVAQAGPRHLFLFNDLLVETIKKGKKFNFVQETRLPNVALIDDTPLSLILRTPGPLEAQPTPYHYIFDQQATRDEARKIILQTCAEAVTSSPSLTASLLPAAFPSCCVDAAAVRVDAFVYVFGGQSAPGVCSNAFFRGTIRPADGANPAAPPEIGDWVELPVTPHRPSARSGHSLVAVGHNLYLFGGFNGTERLNDLHIFDTAAGEWTSDFPVQGMAPSPRSGHACLVTADNRRVFVFGGTTSGKIHNDTHILDLHTKTWTPMNPRVTGNPPKARYNAAAFLFGSKAVLFGGIHQFGSLNDLWMFDFTELLWTELRTVGEPPEECTGFSSAALSGNLIVYGGKSMPSDQCYVLNFDGLVWNTISIPPEAVSPSAPLNLASAVDLPDHSAVAFLGGAFKPSPICFLHFSKFRQTQSFKLDADDMGPKRQTFEEAVANDTKEKSRFRSLTGAKKKVKKPSEVPIMTLDLGDKDPKKKDEKEKKKPEEKDKKKKDEKEKKKGSGKEAKGGKFFGTISKKLGKTIGDGKDEPPSKKELQKIVGAQPTNPFVGAADIQGALARRGRGSTVHSPGSVPRTPRPSVVAPPQKPTAPLGSPSASLPRSVSSPNTIHIAPPAAAARAARGGPPARGMVRGRGTGPASGPGFLPSSLRVSWRGQLLAFDFEPAQTVGFYLQKVQGLFPEATLPGVLAQFLDFQKDYVGVELSKTIQEIQSFSSPRIHLRFVHSTHSLLAALSGKFISAGIKLISSSGSTSLLPQINFTSLESLASALEISSPFQVRHIDDFVLISSTSELAELLLELPKFWSPTPSILTIKQLT